MKTVINFLLTFFLVTFFSGLAWSYAPIETFKKEASEKKLDQKAQLRADCLASTKQVDISINNVRARLMNGGDMWWDLEDGRYIVPKVELGSGKLEVSSLFAGSVWLGGVSVDGNLKVAAVTYRSQGRTDYYPGPLTKRGITDKSVCDNWDRFFRVTGEEIAEHIRLWNELGDAYTEDMIPDGVKYYPGAGNPFFAERYEFDIPSFAEDSDYYGYYWNVDDDPNYNPLEGDFPFIQVRGCTPDNTEKAAELVPDEMFFWIYNDAGGPHAYSNANPIQMEVQVQAFAYKTQDEFNNMTFYRHRLINQAQVGIGETYFAMWVDPDLGCPEDDYIGSDTTRSLMYVYNSKAVDGSPGAGSTCTVFGRNVPSYGDEIPMVGVDYFRGPLDSFGVELGMSSFTYFNNPSIGTPEPGTTDPSSGREVYNYLTGRWKDGSHVQFGGDGYRTGGRDVNYVFVDPPNRKGGWSMAQENLPYLDVRTIQASGPFFLKPGVVNELIIGVVWVPAVDHPEPSLEKITKADDMAQGLFDNCFDMLDGPDAPDLSVVELDQEVIFVLTNDTVTSNNKFLTYEERVLIDLPDSIKSLPDADTTYSFQGYRVYQLRSITAENTPGGRKDPSNARLVFQTDIKDNISTIYNYDLSLDPTNPSEQISIPIMEVEGPNSGLQNSFLVTRDQFTGERLRNNSKYYYTVVAYAYNNYQDFRMETGTPIGQHEPYIEGRGNVDVYTVIPRQTTWMQLNSVYGQGFEVTQLDGEGVGGNFTRITDETREKMLASNEPVPITYLPGFSPISLKVVNPLQVKGGDYVLKVFDNNPGDNKLDFNETRLQLINTTTRDTLTTKTTLAREGEVIAGEFGISVFLNNGQGPGKNNLTDENGAIGQSIVYNDPTLEPWFGYYEEGNYTNWILDGNSMDPKGAFNGGVMAGPFYPFVLGTSEAPNDLEEPVTPNNYKSIARPVYYGGGEASMSNVRAGADIDELPNVDIVFTPDKSKWSRSIVLETYNMWYEDQFAGINVGSVGNAPNMGIRKSPSVTKDDNDGDGKADVDPNETRQGFGWFPGYAIDVVTGKRLNIMFGENSMFNSNFPYDSLDVVKEGSFTADDLNNGADMMWNPTGLNIASMDPTDNFRIPLTYANGSHFIYIMYSEYDGCEEIYNTINFVQNNPSNYAKILRSNFAWVAAPNIPSNMKLKSYAEGLIPDETVVSIRVDGAFKNRVITGDNNGNPMYSFTIDGASRSPYDPNKTEDLLKEVVAVPNPYRGLSSYEVDASNNLVKITNLPPQCVVTIYSLDGKFIRQYKVNEAMQRPTFPGNDAPFNNPGAPERYYNTIIEWDMNNNAGIPVSSGVYLIHIDAPGIGQKVIKWFGVHKKFDPSIF